MRSSVLVIPRALDANLLGSQGLNVTEYSVLMNLSEAPGRSLRMSELADYVSISVSGLTRVIERLARQGLVERVRAQSDGRGQVAVLTPAGLDRLQQAWPTHLASVRRHMMDHLDGIDLTAFARAVSAMASTEVGPPARRKLTGASKVRRPPATRPGRQRTRRHARPDQVTRRRVSRNAQNTHYAPDQAAESAAAWPSITAGTRAGCHGDPTTHRGRRQA